jgi:hypothetical protein
VNAPEFQQHGLVPIPCTASERAGSQRTKGNGISMKLEVPSAQCNGRSQGGKPGLVPAPVQTDAVSRHWTLCQVPITSRFFKEGETHLLAKQRVPAILELWGSASYLPVPLNLNSDLGSGLVGLGLMPVVNRSRFCDSRADR